MSLQHSSGLGRGPTPLRFDCAASLCTWSPVTHSGGITAAAAAGVASGAVRAAGAANAEESSAWGGAAGAGCPSPTSATAPMTTAAAPGSNAPGAGSAGAGGAATSSTHGPGYETSTLSRQSTSPGAALAAAVGPAPLPLPPAAYPCKVITDQAPEGIRGVYIVPSGSPLGGKAPIKPGSVIAVVGDLLLRILPSLTDTSTLTMRFQRHHTDRLCAETAVLQHNHTTALITPCDPYACVVLDTLQQKQFVLSQLDVPQGARPIHFDSRRVAWLSTHARGATLLTVASVAGQVPTHFAAVPASARVVSAHVSGSRAIFVCNGAWVYALPLLPVAAFTEDSVATVAKLAAAAAAAGRDDGGSVPYSPNDWADVPSELVDVVVARCAAAAALPPSGADLAAADPRSSASVAVPGAGAAAEAVAAAAGAGVGAGTVEEAAAVGGMTFLAHNQGELLALRAENGGDVLMTLGSEGKIKLWHKGLLVAKFDNIGGTFERGYPVVLRRRGQAVYYTSDEGLFVLNVPFPIVGAQGELRLGGEENGAVPWP